MSVATFNATENADMVLDDPIVRVKLITTINNPTFSMTMDLKSNTESPTFKMDDVKIYT